MNLKGLISSSKKSSPNYLSNFPMNFQTFLDALFSDISDLRSATKPIHGFPSISLSEDDNTITLKAELPAMTEKDVKIEINKNRLTVSGEKKSEIDEERSIYHVCELMYGRFSRTVTLPFEIETDKTKAFFEKGVLTIKIQKPDSEISQSRSIPIVASTQ